MIIKLQDHKASVNHHKVKREKLDRPQAHKATISRHKARQEHVCCVWRGMVGEQAGGLVGVWSVEER